MGVTEEVTAGVDPRSVPHESQAKIRAAEGRSTQFHQQVTASSRLSPPTTAVWRICRLSPGPAAQFLQRGRPEGLRLPVAGNLQVSGGYMASRTESLWRATHQVGGFAPLDRNLEVDVAIVGGGISGLTAALILSRTGKRVAVLERDTIGSGETGNTTSHLTEAVDRKSTRLNSSHG